jgi:hypothetical protein
VTVSPDSLAGHPAVARAPEPFEVEPLFYEGVSYAAPEAWEQVAGGGDFYDAVDQSQDPDGHRHDADEPAGEDFDFDDPAEMRRRLPRLAALDYPDGSG